MAGMEWETHEHFPNQESSDSSAHEVVSRELLGMLQCHGQALGQPAHVGSRCKLHNSTPLFEIVRQRSTRRGFGNNIQGVHGGLQLEPAGQADKPCKKSGFDRLSRKILSGTILETVLMRSMS